MNAVRWPREEWLEAFAETSAPRPPERAVAVEYWRLARDGASQVQVQSKDLAARCGLSRAAAHDAVRYLIATGWLTPVGVPKSGRTVPHELTLGRDADARLEGHQRARRAPREVVQDDLSAASEVVRDDFSIVREVVQDDLSAASEVVLDDSVIVQDDFSPIAPISPTRTPTPTRNDAVDALWLVVVGGLPPALGLSLARTTRIADALGRHHDDGWTPETLAAAVVAKDWTGARGGLVDTWLTNLPKPDTAGMPTAPGRPAWCGDCDRNTRQRETADGDPYRCPRCHPKSAPLRAAS